MLFNINRKGRCLCGVGMLFDVRVEQVVDCCSDSAVWHRRIKANQVVVVYFEQFWVGYVFEKSLQFLECGLDVIDVKAGWVDDLGDDEQDGGSCFEQLGHSGIEKSL